MRSEAYALVFAYAYVDKHIDQGLRLGSQANVFPKRTLAVQRLISVQN